MKTKLLLFILFAGLHIPLHAQYTAIPDANFEQALINQGIDSEALLDGQVLTADISGITSLDVIGENIADLAGIEGFTALETLDCSFNDLTALNMEENLNLTQLYCGFNELATLDVTQNPDLTILHCFDNYLTDLDVTQNPNLTILWCIDNQLDNLDITQNTNLTVLRCFYNDLTDLDLSGNPNLTELHCNGNSLNTLDLSVNLNLTELHCNDNSLSTLDLSDNPNLTVLHCNDNSLSTLDLSDNPNLTELHCNDNSLSTLDLSDNPNLTGLHCNGNSLSTLDLNTNTYLFELQCSNSGLTTLYLSLNTNLGYLDCSNNQLTILGLSQNTNLDYLDCSNNQLTALELRQDNNLDYLDCSNNELTTLELRQNDFSPALSTLNCNNNQLIGGLSLIGFELTNFDASVNPELSCIQVDNATDANAVAGIYATWIKDGTASYSEESCSTIALGTGSGSGYARDANTFIGYFSGLYTSIYDISIGHSNTYIGSESGYTNLFGTNNVFLGHRAGYNEIGSSNLLYIDNSDTDNPLIWGDFTDSNEHLRINGTLNIRNAYSFPTTDGTTGQILATDGSGTVSWGGPVDNLGGHSATQNIMLNGHRLSGDGDSEGITIDTEGNVSINATPPDDGAALTVNGTVQIGDVTTPGSGTGYNLYVETGVITEKIRVAIDETLGWAWPDYVFEKDYPLKSLAEVETFIQQHHRLPGIPSAAEVAREGIDLAQMDAKLLQKTEELTLYKIQQEKALQQQQQRIAQLIERIEQLENQ